MADEAREHIHIDAPPQLCFESVIDFERYPLWATDVKDAEILAWDDDGRGRQVRYEVAAMGLTVGYILDYQYADAPGRLAWTLSESDMLRALDGSYEFAAEGAGTAVTYHLMVDLALPLPGFVKRKAAEMIAQNAMREFKTHVEAQRRR